MWEQKDTQLSDGGKRKTFYRTSFISVISETWRRLHRFTGKESVGGVQKQA